MSWTYTLRELAAMTGLRPIEWEATFSGVSTDTRTIQPGNLFVALRGEQFDGADYMAEAFAKGAAACLASRPFEEKPVLVTDDPLDALQRFAARHRSAHEIPLLAITGSCGKTSSKDFCAALLETRFNLIRTQGNFNNEIGCPLSLLQIDRSTEFAIIEMGARFVGNIGQLCRIARPTESAITMIGPAHLECFGSIERVAATKSEIASGLGVGGVFYVNNDDPWCRRIGEHYGGQKVYFGSNSPVAIKSMSFLDDGDMLLDIDPVGKLRLPLPIPAQAQNVLLAVAVALRHGVTAFEEPLRAACASSIRFKVRQLGPFEVLEDVYNANPASVSAALEALAQRPGSGRSFAALGAMLELGPQADVLHREIGALAGELGYAGLLGRGPLAHDMIRGARDAGVATAEVIDDHAALARRLLELGQPGDRLLVKGSRGMRMEKVLSALEEHLVGQDSPPTGSAKDHP